jgi:hypothetical protein
MSKLRAEISDETTTKQIRTTIENLKQFVEGKSFNFQNESCTVLKTGNFEPSFDEKYNKNSFSFDVRCVTGSDQILRKLDAKLEPIGIDIIKNDGTKWGSITPIEIYQNLSRYGNVPISGVGLIYAATIEKARKDAVAGVYRQFPIESAGLEPEVASLLLSAMPTPGWSI